MTGKMRIIKTGIALACMSLFSALVLDSGARAQEGNAPAEAKKLKNPLKPTEENLKAGRELYLQCTMCHGTDGKSKTRLASSMDPKPADLTDKAIQALTDGEIFWVITNGTERSVMPDYGATMSETERWQVTLYVRQLAKAPEAK